MLISNFSIIAFLSVFAIVAIALIVSLYFLFRLLKIFANIENNSEASIEIIDHQYSKMISIIDGSHFMMDEPIIQEFIKEFSHLKGDLRTQVSELFLSKNINEVEIKD